MPTSVVLPAWRQVFSLLRLLSQTVAGLRPHLLFREAHISPVTKTGCGSREVPLAPCRLPMSDRSFVPHIRATQIRLEVRKLPAADRCLQFRLFKYTAARRIQKCGRRDLNSQGPISPLGPQPSASANSATSACTNLAVCYQVPPEGLEPPTF